MNLIREIYQKDINIENKRDENKLYYIRKASRAIVFNEENKIAILNVTKDRYHKLPGGGIEGNEDIIEALNRELMEEVGVKVEITGEIGCIIEYRDEFNQLQISYCYKARVIKNYHKTSFTKEEKDCGFELQWVELDSAKKCINEDNPTNYIGKFIRERDLTFLNDVK